MKKSLPFNKAQIEKIIEKYPTPFHIYDELSIKENARRFYKVFNWVDGFKNFFAVKACPNPHIPAGTCDVGKSRYRRRKYYVFLK